MSERTSHHYCIILLILILPIAATAQDTDNLILAVDRLDQQGNTVTGFNLKPYNLETQREIWLLSGGTAMSLAGLIMMENITPLTPQQISELNPAAINNFDRHNMGHYRENWNGDLMLYLSFALPFTFAFNEQMRRDWQTLAVLGAEVVLIQSGINSMVKRIALRTRPYVYQSDVPTEKKTSKDARVSFYSGHTSTTAAICFYVAAVYAQYLHDPTAKYLIWTAAALYPAVTGYLRVASGNHFVTDVLAGYTAGALIGYFIPRLHRSENKYALSLDYINYAGVYHLGLKYQLKF
jgi:membrane-associated phospholipid phosphatase